jgi:excisionase family DNA binding protein
MSTDDTDKLEPLALAPREAARFLSISKRSLSRLIVEGKIIARKVGTRTLVDLASLKAYYDGLPMKHQACGRG